MRIASYLAGGRPTYGVVSCPAGIDDFAGATVVDIPASIPGAPQSVVEFLPRSDEFAAAIEASTAVGVPLADVELLPVVPSPGNIICVGVNYIDHATETGMSRPEFPVIFSKFTSSISAHNRPIVIPATSSEPDYEAELGLVIAREARNVAIDDALDYVGAYFTFNDVSARDYQTRTSQWTQGKGFDTFAPTGPFMVTTDELGDPQDLDIRLVIGDEVLQSANTRDMIFDVRTLVSYLSRVCTLRPGDIIATGTPSGIGAARDPQRFLRPGDVVRVEIEGLPTLINQVQAAE